MKRSLRVLVVVLAALGVPGATADAAQPAGPGNVADLSLEELMAIPVFAASGYEQDAADAPSRVSVITRDQIRLFGYRTLAEAIAGQAGFFSNYDRQYHYLAVRGFGPPGDYNSRILVLLNGQRTNDELFGGAGVGTDFLLDLGLVERIEIIRGTGSSLYGSNAFLAVINVITRRGGAVDGAEVEGIAASHGTRGGRLSYGRSFGDDGEVLVSGTLGRTDGQDLYFEKFDAPETSQGWARGLDGEESASLFLDIRKGELDLQVAWADRTKEIPTAPWETMFNEPGQEVTDTWFLVGLSWERALGGAGRVSTRLSYLDYRGLGSYPYDWAEEGEEPLKIFAGETLDASWWSAEARFVSEALARNKVHAGIEYRDAFRLDQATHEDVAEDPAFLSREDGVAWGAYLQDEIQLAGWALLSAGLRFDRSEPRGEQTLSPRLGLILTPAPATRVKLLYGKAFRSPNAYELYYDDAGLSQKSNPNLDSETIDSYEVSLEQQVGKVLRATLSAFHWSIDGLIRQTVDPEDDLLVFGNIERAVADGIEAELNADLPCGASATATYAYTVAEDRSSGERLVNSPLHVAALRLLVPVVPDRVYAGVETRYVGERRTATGMLVDGVFLANANLTAASRDGRWEASAGIYNALNATYADPVGNEHLQDSIEQDGRTFRVKLTARF